MGNCLKYKSWGLKFIFQTTLYNFKEVIATNMQTKTIFLFYNETYTKLTVNPLGELMCIRIVYSVHTPHYLNCNNLLPVYVCQKKNTCMHIQWDLVHWDTINLYASHSNRMFWGTKYMKTYYIWFNYSDTSFIRTIFLGTKVFGLMRLQCIYIQY
jgi:hypothetical protein